MNTTLRYSAFAAALVATSLGGSLVARADDCAALQAGLDRARNEMLDAEKEMAKHSAVINHGKRELDHWVRRVGELGQEMRALQAELSRPDRDPQTTPSLNAKIVETERELARSTGQMAALNKVMSGEFGQTLEVFIAASRERHQRATLSQDSIRRDMDRERCAAKLHPAAPRPDPGSATSAAAPPADLPPLPALPPAVDAPPPRLPQSPQVATAAPGPALPPLPPLPPINEDGFVIPPRPSTLTQPPIVEPPAPVAGLPPLPALPPIASAPPASTEVIRAPVIRAPNVNAPPIIIPQIHAPPVHAPAVRAPPVVIPRVSAAPIETPIVRAPPIHVPRIEAPNIRGPRVGIGTRDRRDTLLTPDRRPANTRVIHNRHRPVAVPPNWRVAPRSTATVVRIQPRVHVPRAAPVFRTHARMPAQPAWNRLQGQRRRW